MSYQMEMAFTNACVRPSARVHVCARVRQCVHTCKLHDLEMGD